VLRSEMLSLWNAAWQNANTDPLVLSLSGIRLDFVFFLNYLSFSAAFSRATAV
jgi:hypothetical protein